MNRSFLPAFAAALALSAWIAPAAAATTTTTVPLSTSAYTDLGVGPMYLSAGGAGVIYQTADAGPPSIVTAGHSIQPGQQPILFQTTSHVWALASTSAARAIVSAGAGITVGGGGGTGGGGGAVTVADGADIAEGTTTDPAFTAGAGTTIALLKGSFNKLASIVANTAAPTAQGVTASGAALTENPLANGGRAATTDPTSVADGQKVSAMMTKGGKAVVMPYAVPELWNESGGNDATGSAAPITVLAASGSASLREWLKSIHCDRDDAGTTAIRVTITEGTKTRFLVVPNSGSGGANNRVYDPPISFAANAAVTATPSASVAGNFSCDGQGYNAP